MLLDLNIEMKEAADPSAFFEVPLKAAVCPKCGYLEPYVACPQELMPKTEPLEGAEEKKEKQVPWQNQKKKYKEPWE